MNAKFLVVDVLFFFFFFFLLMFPWSRALHKHVSKLRGCVYSNYI